MAKDGKTGFEYQVKKRGLEGRPTFEALSFAGYRVRFSQGGRDLHGTD